MKRILFTLLLFAAISPAFSQIIDFNKKNKIISGQAEEAAVLQKYMSEATGFAFPVSTKGKASAGDIIIRSTDMLPEDAFRVYLEDGKIILEGDGKSMMYAVCDFLEQEMGMDYWGGGEYNLPKRKSIVLRPRTEVPAFRYRQTSHYNLWGDPLLRDWLRLENPSDLFVKNLWVHTCNALLPASRYGKEHPEYYAFFNGERHPGSASQWCMTNPEVLEIVCGTLDSLFRAHPQQKMISISQNDGSDTYCRCPECAAIIEEEGSPSGPILRFINAVAQRFPDKEISTLAYLFSVKEPAVTKPLPNVSIMLCDIDCRRQTALPYNPSGQEFMSHLEGWSRICDNIFLWDYGTNFDNYLSPFPNLQTIKDNMLIFRDHGVKMHFSQINSSRGAELAEIRPYLVSKLMWNPDASLDSLERHFCESYFGAAAPHILKYIHTLEGASMGCDVDLFIYDSPVSFKETMLRPTIFRHYKRIFDEAEAAVADDSLRLARVRRARLPLQFSELEIARTDPDRDAEAVEKALDLFESRIKEFDVPTLNERRNSPLEYCQLYRTRYLHTPKGNLAAGCPVTFITPPPAKYATLAKTALTDGLYGGAGYVENWIGWEGEDACFIIDLGAEKIVKHIGGDFLRQVGAWVLEPAGVQYSTSTDGENFSEFGSVKLPENRDMSIGFKDVSVEGKAVARYVKVNIEGVKICPEWHFGVGNKCWFFIDEICVY